MDFKRVTIITGGANGMGEAVGKEVAKNNGVVCLLDLSQEVLKKGERLKEEGYNVKGFVCDVTNKEEVQRIFKEIYEEFGSIDNLVNAAGISASVDFLNEDLDEIKDRIMNVNFNGTWNTCRAAIPYMLRGERGSILNFSSVTGNLVTDPGMSAYGASKAAVAGLTKTLAVEFADRGINANCILPGYVWTDMIAKYDPENPEKVKERFSQGIPMRRVGYVEEVGKVVAFYLSEGAAYITGQSIVFDGGTTLVETKKLIDKGKKEL